MIVICAQGIYKHARDLYYNLWAIVNAAQGLFNNISTILKTVQGR